MRPEVFTIERIEKALEEKDKDYILQLKNKFHTYKLHLDFLSLGHIQPGKSKVLKKNTQALMWTLRGRYSRIILIRTPKFRITFEYHHGDLYELSYRKTCYSNHLAEFEFKK